MKIIRFINEFFLSDDTEEIIHWSDYAWFYGTYSFAISVPILLWLYIR